jgi:hypothetical protein
MLKDIGEKDFWPAALAHYGFTPSIYEDCTKDMPPALKEQVDKDIAATVKKLKRSEVAHYALSDEGQKEINQLRSDSLAKIERVQLHRDAVVLSQKLNRETGSEILKRDDQFAELFVFEIFIKNSFIPKEKAQAADEQLKAIAKELASFEPREFAENLCENPLWFHEFIGKLETIDHLYAEAMPKKQFPPDETIRKLKKTIMGPDWTPEVSVLAFAVVSKNESLAKKTN